MNLLDINTIFITIFDYPLSYIEFFGTIFYLLAILLVAKKNILNWPIGIIGVVLYMILFYQIQLYSDLIEQVYYLITGFYGWYIWREYKKKDKEITIIKNTKRENIIWLIIILVGTMCLNFVTINLNTWFPAVFTLPASFPLLDSFTTSMSFAAQILMTHRRIENWYLWILVDVIAIGLYFVKDVKFLSVLYVVFLISAIKGYLNWRKEIKND